jgi:ribosomal protein L32
MNKKDSVKENQSATTLGRKKEGEQVDPESGRYHLAHALCCLMFLYEHDMRYSVDKS